MKKDNRMLIILMVIIIVILLVLCILFATDKIILNNDTNKSIENTLIEEENNNLKTILSNEQAKNIAKAGTVDSLIYDSKYGAVYATQAMGISLAISFAINDMLSLQKQVTYNVLFFDEILDSSLDDKSLNIILNFIYSSLRKPCFYSI